MSIRRLVMVVVSAEFADTKDLSAFATVAKSEVENLLKNEAMDTANVRNFEVEVATSELPPK